MCGTLLQQETSRVYMECLEYPPRRVATNAVLKDWLRLSYFLPRPAQSLQHVEALQSVAPSK